MEDIAASVSYRFATKSIATGAGSGLQNDHGEHELVGEYSSIGDLEKQAEQ